MCDACLLLIKGFQEEQNPFGKGVSGSYRSHFSTGCAFGSGGAPLCRVFTQRSGSHSGQGWGHWRLTAGAGNLGDAAVAPPTSLHLSSVKWSSRFPLGSRISSTLSSFLGDTPPRWLVRGWARDSPRTNGRKDTFTENSGTKIAALSVCVQSRGFCFGAVAVLLPQEV